VLNSLIGKGIDNSLLHTCGGEGTELEWDKSTLDRRMERGWSGIIECRMHIYGRLVGVIKLFTDTRERIGS
jgi:hypothetical protein